MSSALAIASVTAVLKSILENGLADRSVTSSIGGDTLVSALPPDRITTGSDERPQLNLFLYQITPHTGMRMSSRRTSGIDDPSAASVIALDLHFLLTAYGAQDFQIEILLGYAMQIMNQNLILHRDTIHSALSNLSSDQDGGIPSPALAALAASDLAEQVEQIELKPQFLSSEELSKLWSALQAKYRPSAGYKASLVLIDARR